MYKAPASSDGQDVSYYRNAPRGTHRSFGLYSTTLGGESATSFEDLPPTSRDLSSTEYGPLKARAESANDAHKSNTKAVLKALKGLQEKIRRLELERVDAEQNLKSIAVETDEYKDILRKEHSMSEAVHTAVEHHNKELEKQLYAAGERCGILEKQLDYMRSLVHPLDCRSHPNNARDSHTDERASSQSPLILGAEKLAELQREHIKFTASQTLAESKIRELEEKIKVERHQRELLQDKAADLQTVAETHRILLGLNGLSDDPKPAKISRTKKTKARSRSSSSDRPKQQSHYKVNMATIPFVVGQSTSRSHSLGANIQNVLSLMKSHNPQLCGTAAKSRLKYPTRSSLVKSESEDGLADLLLGLQDEFGHLGFEHKELVKQIEETKDPALREDLERELDQLVAKMESKGQQIALVKHHQQNDLRSNGHQPRRKDKRVMSVKGTDLEVVTTVRSRGKSTSSKAENGDSRDKQQTRMRTHSHPNYDVLKKVKQLQNTLRQDDLSWD